MFITLSSQFISYSRKNSFDILPLPLISWAWLGHIITQNCNPSIVSVWFSQPINYLIAYSVRYPVLIPFSVMLGYQFTLSTFIVPHPLDILALFPWLPFHLTYLRNSISLVNHLCFFHACTCAAEYCWKIDTHSD